MSHNGKYYVHKLKAKEENSKDIRAMFKTAKKPRYVIKNNGYNFTVYFP